MDTINAENTSNQDLDDSGCVQDASVTENGYKGQVQLLDLSDDVLLYILKNCTPRDLKALGHTCSRLGALVCDRTLWTRVDARSSPIGQERLRWLLTHCLSPATKELKLTGHANTQSKCLGIQDLHWPVDPDSGPGVDVEHFLLRMWYPHLPRFAVSPRWPDKEEVATVDAKKAQAVKEGKEYPNEEGASTSTETPPRAEASEEPSTSKPKRAKSPPKELAAVNTDCKGPHFTLTAELLRELRCRCSQITSLFLEYCNIDYKATNICQFPKNLKKLSLRGTLCYNLPLNTSYLGKIQERLPQLEYLDVSGCDWFEPASLMPLSKLACLRVLYMRDCKRLSECVAYASLATRYGFRELRFLDCRGSPLADSEISALGWLPHLEELYCAPPEEFISSSEHTHSWKDTTLTFDELDLWEKEEPDYYKEKIPEPFEEIEEEVEGPPKEAGAEPEAVAPQEQIGDVLMGNPWWLHERRIIVIQPNGTRQMEQRVLRARPQVGNLGHVEPRPDAADRGEAPDQGPSNQDPAPAAEAANKGEAPMEQGPAPVEENQPPKEQGSVANQAAVKEPVPMEQGPPQDQESRSSNQAVAVDQVAGPSNQTPAPINKESAPVDQAPAPVDQGPAPIDQAPAPMDQGSGEPGDQVAAPVEAAAPTDQGPAPEAGPSKRANSDADAAPNPGKRPRLDDDPDDEDNKKPSPNANACPNNIQGEPQPVRRDPRVHVFIGGNEITDHRRENPHRVHPRRAGLRPGDHHHHLARVVQGVPVFNSRPQGQPPPVREQARAVQLFINNEAELLELGDDHAYIRIPIDIPRELRPRERLYVEHVIREPPFPDNEDPAPNQIPPPQNGVEHPLRLRNQVSNAEIRARFAEYRRNAENNVNLDVQRQSTIHIGHAGYHLVSDSAILRFGRADNDNVNYVHIGPNGIRAGESGTRPDRSNLRVLSATGYRNITDRSLVHLASAAPHIVCIDFSQTNVTAKGVEIFKAIRPDVQVIFSEYSKKD